jgi:hypothetical protein
MLKLWQEVRLGEYKSTQAIREALSAAGVRLSSWPEELIDQVPLATAPKTIRLAVVRPSELFPGQHVRLNTIYNEAERLSGIKCSPEVALILHLQVQTVYSTLYAVAMEPIRTADGKYLVLFSVENGIGSSYRWLRGLDGNPNMVWNPHNDPHLDTIVVQIKDD